MPERRAPARPQHAVERPQHVVERVQARVNVAAIERNCARLAAHAAPAALCAVVKADGYGHGAVASARAALAGGASRLAVVSAGELRELRAAGLGDVPVLVMGVLTQPELADALADGGEVVVWSEEHVAAVARAGGGRVHVKHDTGMGRLGTRDPAQAMRVLAAAQGTPGVELAGAMTHFATADEMDDGGFFAQQLGAFTAWVEQARRVSPDLLVHAANSAALLRERQSCFDMVRCGIAVYGMDPFGADPAARELEPALELCSYVAEVKLCRAGQSAGYGRRFTALKDTWLGVVPVGYGDGWRRNLSNNAEVLVGGRRHPLVGTVSMDSVTIDLGPEVGRAALQEPAVLIGAQGGERITAEEVAARLGTINYEVTCGLTPRAHRLHHRDGVPTDDAGGGLASDEQTAGIAL